jgi:zinc/manganese transport system permease protein
MTDLISYLAQPFVQHAFLATGLIAVICGLIGPFVIMRNMAFAVHGTSELAFTGAAGGLLIGGNPIVGAFAGAIIVASLISLLGSHAHERDSAIGVILAFGLGVGVLLLSFYRGFATQATNILFGNIFGVSSDQLILLLVMGLVAGATILWVYKPLLFASVDPEVAAAKGLPLRALSFVFLLVLAVVVTEAAQVVGTLLVLSLAITPAAAAQRLSSRPLAVTVLSVIFALAAGFGGLLIALIWPDVKPSVGITFVSFAIYAICRLNTFLLRKA